MSLVVTGLTDYSASTVSNTVTWHTVATFKATNINQIMDVAWNSGAEPFLAKMDVGDEGDSNYLNQNPVVIDRIPGPDTSFTIDWGHQADTVGCMIVPNADYTSFSVQVGYRYLQPGTYHWNLVIVAIDGSDQLLSGTATINGPDQSKGTIEQNNPLSETTYVSFSDMA